jgi:hypothetical protein
MIRLFLIVRNLFSRALSALEAKLLMGEQPVCHVDSNKPRKKQDAQWNGKHVPPLPRICRMRSAETRFAGAQS